MILPNIHTGGTSKETLLNDLADVIHSLDESLREITRVTPHQRDYLDQEQYKLALSEHVIRYKLISDVKKDFEKMQWEISLL